MSKKKLLTSSARCCYKGPAQISKEFKLPGIKFVEEMQKDNIIGHFIINSSEYEFDDGEESRVRSEARKEVEDKVTAVENLLNLWIDDGYFEIRKGVSGYEIFDAETGVREIESGLNIGVRTIRHPYEISELPNENSFEDIITLSTQSKNKDLETFKIMMEFYNSGKALKESYHRTSFLMFYKVIETFWAGWMNKKMYKADELWEILKLSDVFGEEDVKTYIVNLAELEKKDYEKVAKGKNKRLLILVAIKAARGKCLTAHGKLKDSVTDRKYYPPVNETEKIAKRAILYFVDEMKKRMTIDLRSEVK